VNTGEIVEEVRDRLDIPTTSTHTRMIKAAINAEYRATCGERNYRFLMKTGTAALSATGIGGPLPADFRSCLLAGLDSNGIILTPQHFAMDAIINGDPNYQYRGTPASFDIFKATVGFEIVTQPLSSQADTVNLWYIATPAKLVANSDTPIFQEDFHGILVEGACARIMSSRNLDPGLQASARRERDRLIAALMYASPTLNVTPMRITFWPANIGQWPNA